MKKIIIFILLILLIFPFVKSFVKHLHSFYTINGYWN